MTSFCLCSQCVSSRVVKLCAPMGPKKRHRSSSARVPASGGTSGGSSAGSRSQSRRPGGGRAPYGPDSRSYCINLEREVGIDEFQELLMKSRLVESVDKADSKVSRGNTGSHWAPHWLQVHTYGQPRAMLFEVSKHGHRSDRGGKPLPQK